MEEVSISMTTGESSYSYKASPKVQNHVLLNPEPVNWKCFAKKLFLMAQS